MKKKHYNLLVYFKMIIELGSGRQNKTIKSVNQG